MNLRVEGGTPRRPLIHGLAGARRSKARCTAPPVNDRRRMSFLTRSRTGEREDRDKRWAIP
jgi:hypothetical protein